MMEANYRPRGWLGLIMGTRLYYKFFGKKLQQESAFEGQMDMLVREIGARGKVQLSEAVPPAAASMTPRGRAPAPAPAPAPEPARAPPRALAPAPAPAPRLTPTPAPAPAATPERSFTPSVRSSAAPSAQLQVADALPLMERLLEEARVEKAEMRAEMEKQRAELQKLRGELTPKPPHDAVSDEQLAALQARLLAAHGAKLLSDEEFFALEDLCADFAELQPPAGPVTSETVREVELADKVRRLVCVSEKMAADASFARQARRKFVP